MQPHEIEKLKSGLNTLISTFNSSIRDISPQLSYFTDNIIKISYSDFKDINGQSFSDTESLLMIFHSTENMPMINAESEFYYEMSGEVAVSEMCALINLIRRKLIKNLTVKGRLLNNDLDFHELGLLVTKAIHDVLYVNQLDLLHDYIKLMAGPDGIYYDANPDLLPGFHVHYPGDNRKPKSVFDKVKTTFGTSDIDTIVHQITLDPVKYLHFGSSELQNQNTVSNYRTPQDCLEIGFYILVQYVSRNILTA